MEDNNIPESSTEWNIPEDITEDNNIPESSTGWNFPADMWGWGLELAPETEIENGPHDENSGAHPPLTVANLMQHTLSMQGGSIRLNNTLDFLTQQVLSMQDDSIQLRAAQDENTQLQAKLLQLQQQNKTLTEEIHDTKTKNDPQKISELEEKTKEMCDCPVCFEEMTVPIQLSQATNVCLFCLFGLIEQKEKTTRHQPTNIYHLQDPLTGKDIDLSQKVLPEANQTIIQLNDLRKPNSNLNESFAVIQVEVIGNKFDPSFNRNSKWKPLKDALQKLKENKALAGRDLSLFEWMTELKKFSEQAKTQLQDILTPCPNNEPVTLIEAIKNKLKKPTVEQYNAFLRLTKELNVTYSLWVKIGLNKQEIIDQILRLPDQSAKNELENILCNRPNHRYVSQEEAKEEDQWIEGKEEEEIFPPDEMSATTQLETPLQPFITSPHVSGAQQRQPQPTITYHYNPHRNLQPEPIHDMGSRDSGAQQRQPQSIHYNPHRNLQPEPIHDMGSRDSEAQQRQPQSIHYNPHRNLQPEPIHDMGSRDSEAQQRQPQTTFTYHYDGRGRLQSLTTVTFSSTPPTPPSEIFQLGYYDSQGNLQTISMRGMGSIDNEARLHRQLRSMALTPDILSRQQLNLIAPTVNPPGDTGENLRSSASDADAWEGIGSQPHRLTDTTHPSTFSSIFSSLPFHLVRNAFNNNVNDRRPQSQVTVTSSSTPLSEVIQRRRESMRGGDDSSATSEESLPHAG